MAKATELPNPYTPLVCSPPALASQLELAGYLYSAALGAYVWDIGLNLGNDYDLLFKHRVRFPTIVYFLSRAFTLAFILTCVVIQVASVKNCNAVGIALDICFVLSQTATAMLFFLRVTAVWHTSKVAYAVFSVLWIAVLGAGITVLLGVRAARIGPTMQCTAKTVQANIEVSVIIPLINDTAIFLAINYRILVHIMVADSSMARLRVFLGGKGLSRLSQALLQTGQHFYLIALVTHILVLVMLKLPHLSPAYRGMLSAPGLALPNAMACLVFRRIKLGLISSDGTFKTPTIAPSSDFHAAANPRSLSLQFHHADSTSGEFRLNTTSPLDVLVHREIVKFEDSVEARSLPSITGLSGSELPL